MSQTNKEQKTNQKPLISISILLTIAAILLLTSELGFTKENSSVTIHDSLFFGGIGSGSLGGLLLLILIYQNCKKPAPSNNINTSSSAIDPYSDKRNPLLSSGPLSL